MAGLEGASALKTKLFRFAGQLEDINASVAAESVPDVAGAVRGDLGDLSMSHWARGHPIQIVAVAMRPGSDGSVAIEPKGNAKGPMRVLNDGRQSYAAGARRNSGTYLSKKTGERTQKTRKVKRTTGAHGGRGTWDDAVKEIEDRLPARSWSAVVGSMGRIFSRG